MPSAGFRKLSPDQEQAICVRYNDGARSSVLAAEHGVSTWTIRQTLVRHEVTRIGEGAAWKRRAEPCREDFFALIDTPEKAYWLGFLHADGCVSKQKQVRLALGHEADASHVGCFLSALGLTRAPLAYNYPRLKKKCFIGAIGSAQMAADLYVLGVSSGRRTWPRIAFGLQSAFCLGLFDGDGSWMMARNGRICASFVAPPDYAEEFALTIRTHTGLLTTPKPYHPKVSYVRYANQDAAATLARWLYSACDIYLPRKRKRVERWVGIGAHQCPR